jgi:hypothetical protein
VFLVISRRDRDRYRDRDRPFSRSNPAAPHERHTRAVHVEFLVPESHVVPFDLDTDPDFDTGYL